MLKIQPELTEMMKINHFHSQLGKDAWQTLKNIQRNSRTSLEDILVLFRCKYVKPQSIAMAKHKRHKIMFNPSEQTLPDFLENLHQTAEPAPGEQAQSMKYDRRSPLRQNTTIAQEVHQPSVPGKWYP